VIASHSLWRGFIKEGHTTENDLFDLPMTIPSSSSPMIRAQPIDVAELRSAYYIGCVIGCVIGRVRIAELRSACYIGHIGVTSRKKARFPRGNAMLGKNT